MATGALIGGLLGTVGGAFAGNPALGYSLGSSLGGVVEGAALMGNANRKGLQANDPRTRLLYDEIVNKRKALETGQMYQPQQDMITQAGARAMNTAAGITGGDIGETVSRYQVSIEVRAEP